MLFFKFRSSFFFMWMPFTEVYGNSFGIKGWRSSRPGEHAGKGCGSSPVGQGISCNACYGLIFLIRTFKPNPGPFKSFADMSSHESEGKIFIKFLRFSVSLHNISNTSSFFSERNALLAFNRQNGIIRFLRSRLTIACISHLAFCLRCPLN